MRLVKLVLGPPLVFFQDMVEQMGFWRALFGTLLLVGLLVLIVAVLASGECNNGACGP
jgi:hypothetical protein